MKTRSLVFRENVHVHTYLHTVENQLFRLWLLDCKTDRSLCSPASHPPSSPTATPPAACGGDPVFHPKRVRPRIYPFHLPPPLHPRRRRRLSLTCRHSLRTRWTSSRTPTWTPCGSAPPRSSTPTRCLFWRYCTLFVHSAPLSIASKRAAEGATT